MSQLQSLACQPWGAELGSDCSINAAECRSPSKQGYAGQQCGPVNEITLPKWHLFSEFEYWLFPWQFAQSLMCRNIFSTSCSVTGICAVLLSAMQFCGVQAGTAWQLPGFPHVEKANACRHIMLINQRCLFHSHYSSHPIGSCNVTPLGERISLSLENDLNFTIILCFVAHRLSYGKGKQRPTWMNTGHLDDSGLDLSRDVVRRKSIWCFQI